jgi:hypothetical protein
MPRGHRPRRGSRLPTSGSRRPSAGPRACRLRPGASNPHSRFQMLPSPARGSTTAGRTRAGCLLAQGRSARAPQDLQRRPLSPQGHMCPAQRVVSRCVAHARAHVIACTQGGTPPSTHRRIVRPSAPRRTAFLHLLLLYPPLFVLSLCILYQQTNWPNSDLPFETYSGLVVQKPK